MTIQKVAIPGGAGFLGQRLAADLKQAGYTPVIGDIQHCDDPELACCAADVTKPETLHPLFEDADIIINLAAEHRDDVRPPARYDQVNVEGARNVCAAADEAGINHIIFTSSVAVYGLTRGRPDENSPHAPFNDYGRTKSEAEAVYQQWFEQNPLERTLTIIRPTVIFGPGNRGNVYNLIRQIASGKFLMIGNGKNCKSMAYVGNVSAFIRYCLDFRPGMHVYNYADKPDFTMNGLVATIYDALYNTSGHGKHGPRLRLPYWLGMTAGGAFDMLARITGRNFPVSRVRVSKFCADTSFDTGKLETSGFTRPYDLHDGLREMISHDFYSSLQKSPEGREAAG